MFDKIDIDGGSREQAARKDCNEFGKLAQYSILAFSPCFPTPESRQAQTLERGASRSSTDVRHNDPDIPYYNPVMLARRLTTLDFLSKGRVRVGLGLGWNKDEVDATGADFSRRGAMADEFLQMLKAIWTTNPVKFHGKFYQVPESYIGPKPVQKPHPPIYMGAFVPRALKRLAKYADGWNPVAIPLDGMAQMFESIKQLAKEAGRDPSRMELVIRAHPEIADKPLSKERSLFSGTLDQIKEDIAGCRNIGAHEIHFDPTFMEGGQVLDRWLAVMEQMRKLVS